MKLLKKTGQAAGASATQLRTDGEIWLGGLSSRVSLGGGEALVYRGMRKHIPILDAAVGKLTKLVGGFSVQCGDKKAQEETEALIRRIPVGRGQIGMENFLGGYVDSMLTYGRAIGEIVANSEGVTAALWGDVTQMEVQQGASPLEITICGPDGHGKMAPLPRQELLLFSTLHAEAGSPYGVSLFRSMPFLAEILMKIYETVGRNWERAGNVRYAVICKPGNESLDGNMAQERSRVMAQQWAKAMEQTRNGAVRDFVAVGDVDIRVIGSDGLVLDSEVPVRQILEQLVARTGLPPFMLGLSWSTTEHMSQQQADMLTSELWSIRRAVTPVIEKIVRTHLRLQGYETPVQVEWEDICLQDMVEEAKAALYRAQAEKIMKEDTNENQ